MGEIVLYEYNFDKPELSEELLMHYGVKGMHWGVRRYQNYDGTRIKRGSGKVFKKNGPSKSSIKRAERKATREAEKKRLQKHKDDIAEMTRNADKYSTKDINEKLNRISAESRLSEMNHQLNPTFRDKVKKITSNRAVKAIAITALAAAVVTGTAMVATRYTKYGPSAKEYAKMVKSGKYLTDKNNMPNPAPPFKEMAKKFGSNYKKNLYNVAIKKIYSSLGLKQK